MPKVSENKLARDTRQITKQFNCDDLKNVLIQYMSDGRLYILFRLEATTREITNRDRNISRVKLPCLNVFSGPFRLNNV